MTRWNLALIAGVLLSTPAVAEPDHSQIYDIVIRGGTVFDGTGGEGQRADVGIRDGYVVAVEDLAGARAEREIDARDRYVAPGFVSVHDHTDPGMHEKPVGLLTQGITTAIMHPDGFGDLDLFARLAGRPEPGINYGAYIGFNSVWAAIIGDEDRRPSAPEIARMQALVVAGLDQGAFGVSAGLDYKPGFTATTAEVQAVVAAARGWRTNFPNHERLWDGNGNSSLAGMAETIAIARAGDMMPVVTHMKMLAAEQGRADEAFAMFRGAEAAGRPVGVDAYPYEYAATALEQILIPAWAQEGGRAAMLRRFADPGQRERIAREASDIIAVRIRGAANVFLPETGRELVSYMEEWEASSGEAVIRLLEQGLEDVMLVSATRADLDRIMLDPRTAMSCDCGAIVSENGHPRNWGAYPLFFGRYVRERGLLGWAEAVRKSTGLPASMIGLVDRGFLLPGMAADITVFDPATIIDRATVPEPTLPSAGIDTVLVNGRIAWHAGRFHPGEGRKLARPEYGVSRVFDLGTQRELLYADAVVEARISQNGMASAQGTIRIVPESGDGQAFLLDKPSLVQAAGSWVAVSGMGRDAGGQVVPMTFVVDHDHRNGGRWWLVVAGVTVRTGVTLASTGKQ